MTIPKPFTQSTLTKEDVIAAYTNRTPVTVDGYTGYIHYYDPIELERGGSPWFYMCDALNDPTGEEYGPYVWVY